MHRPIIVHHQAHVKTSLRAADELGLTLTFQTPPHAMRLLGPQYLRAMFADIHPPHTVIVDCGDVPGHVLAAFRTGFLDVMFSGDALYAEKFLSMGVRLATPATHRLDLYGVQDVAGELHAFLRHAPV